MFSWFNGKPDCPVSEQDCDWIESSLVVLRHAFGDKRFIEGRVVLPDTDFFPDSYDGSDEAITKMFWRICMFMGIPAKKIKLRLFDFGQAGGQQFGGSYAAGLYEPNASTYDVSINTNLRRSQTAITAVIAHELCHVLLLGELGFSSFAEDNEALTDLATIPMGMGIFTANSVLRLTNGGMAKQGYLPVAHLAYGLAYWQFCRGADDKVAWPGYLDDTVQSIYKRSLKYICSRADEIDTRSIRMAENDDLETVAATMPNYQKKVEKMYREISCALKRGDQKRVGEIQAQLRELLGRIDPGT